MELISLQGKQISLKKGSAEYQKTGVGVGKEANLFKLDEDF